MINDLTKITDSPPLNGSINTHVAVLDLITVLSSDWLLTWSELAVFGQLVYALFQQNWDEDVVIGHLAGRQSVGKEWEMRQCVWERNKQNQKNQYCLK